MAKSLDQLIQYLLDEIAVCGPRGVAIPQVTQFVRSFYADVPADDQKYTSSASSSITTSDRQTVDDHFIAKVWKWLGKHPDVSIGRNGKYNDTPLEHFQSHSPSTGQNWKNRVPKVFVSGELIYRAICGHALDRSRLFPSEYALLSQIAAARDDGILQGELGRLTGQDKRSVPKRTDALQAKGYIVKQPITVKGTKTSLLILRRYAKNLHSLSDQPVVADGIPSLDVTNNGKLLVRHIVQHLSNVLSDGSLVEFDKLLGLLNDESEAAKKILSKIVRLLEKAGTIKRVKTAFGPAAHSGDLKTYVQLIRVPSEDDLTAFSKASIPLNRSMLEWLNDERVKAAARQPSGGPQEPQLSGSLIQWNPDRLLANVFRDAALKSGSQGLTNALAQNKTTGSFIWRKLHSLLDGLSHRGLLSQPDGLQHLSIIRSTRVTDGYLEYVYHSFSNFLDGIKAGSIDIASVPGAKGLLESKSQKRPEITTIHDDIATCSLSQLVDDESVDDSQAKIATLAELIQSTNAKDVIPRSGEPQIVRSDDGLEVVEWLARERLAEEVESPEVRFTRSKRQKKTNQRKFHSDSDERPRGRPRKFVSGTEKFWQYQFWQAKLAAVGEDNVPPTREGVMNDPAGLDLFEGRPDDFDETLVEAKAVGLPVPAAPHEITQDWVRQTQAVVERSNSGAYITPVGMYLGRVKYRSQLLIVRSSRLNSVDWHDRSKVPDFRFISSTAAHSFQCRRYYPQMAKLPRRLSRPPKKPLGQAHTKQRETAAQMAINGPGPQLGTFIEKVTARTNASRTTEILRLDLPPGTTSDYHLYMDTTDSDQDLKSTLGQSRKTPRLRRSTQRVPESQISQPLPRRSLSVMSTVSSIAVSPRDSLEPALYSEDRAVDASNVVSKYLDTTTEEQDHSRISKQTLMIEVTDDPPSIAPVLPSLEAAVTNDRNKVTDLPAIAHNYEQLPTEQFPMYASTAHSIAASNEALALANEVPADASNAPVIQPLDIPIGSQDPLSELIRRRTSLSIASNDYAFDTALENRAPIANRLCEDRLSSNNRESQSTDNADAEHRFSVEADAKSLADQANRQQQTRKPLPSFDESDDEFEPQSPINRQRRARDGTGVLCQTIILELVTLARGSAPNNRTTLQRCMVNRWQAGGGKDRPLMKPIKTAVNSLVGSGQLKEHIFTFRGKGGVTIRRSILHLPSIDAASAQINEVKKIIVDADATEYVPQEWVAETLPPSQAARHRRKTSSARDQVSNQPMPISEESPQSRGISHLKIDVTPPVELAGDTRPKRTPKRRKVQGGFVASTPQVTASPEPEPESSQATGSLTLKLCTRAPDPAPSPATGFLTLKVPHLHHLHEVDAINSSLQQPSWKPLSSPVPLKFNTAALSGEADPPPVPKSQRKVRPKQQPKTTRPNDSMRNIIWAPPEQILPENLKHLLRLEALKGNSVRESDVDDLSAIDIVARWEERDAAFIQSKDAKWTFINHKGSADLSGGSNIRGWLVVYFDDDFQESERECVDFPSWAPFSVAQQQKTTRKRRLVRGKTSSQEASASPGHDRRVTRQATGAVKKRKWTSLDQDSGLEAEVSPKPKRTKRVGTTTLTGSAHRLRHKDRQNSTAFSPRQNKTAQLPPQKARPLLEDEDLQLAITVVCVRTLAGGIEKAIDWNLVLRLLPEQKAEMLKRWWKSISQRYWYEVNQLSECFQDAYVNAFQQGEAPPIDFNNLDDTDWAGIVTWARAHLDTQKLYEGKGCLAPSRAQLFQNDDVQVEEVRGLKEMYGYNIRMSSQAREEIHCMVVGGAAISKTPCQNPVQPADESEVELNDPVLVAARSYVLAAIQTGDETFDLKAAQEKLHAVADSTEESEVIVKKAVLALQREKIIINRQVSQTERSELRQWQLSEELGEILVSRRLVHRPMLKAAALYKFSTLDSAFSRGRTVTIAKDAVMDDGFMLAILNLISQAQIEIRPGVDVPSSRYGIDWQNVGYQSKLIEKSKVAFSTVLQPMEAYQLDDPLVSTRNAAVPRGGIQEPRGQIPLWFDINGSLQVEMWETVLAAILGLLSIRPGVNAREIAHMLSWAVTPWEVDLVLHWGQDSALTQQTQSGNGWNATEWWWMALGHDIEWR